MKNEIEEVVHNHFKKIDKLFPLIITDFQIEDIHKFRTETKKLRAFLHLLDMEVDDGFQFKITRKMKTFYGYVGIIRNIQLHLDDVTINLENSIDKIPASYKTKLESDLEYWKVKTKEFMGVHNNFLNDKEKIISGLPCKLKKVSIRNFIQYIVYELKTNLIRLNDDETFHSIRKLLKDILYNFAYIHPYIAPIYLSQKKEIESLTEMLGKLQDRCIAITLLQTYYNDLQEGEEKMIIQKIANTYTIKKRELKQIICSKLELIPLTPRLHPALLKSPNIDQSSSSK